MSNMKVARFYPPGGVENLRLQEEPLPSEDLKENEVLIKVYAVSLIWPELTWPIYQTENGDYFSHIPGHDFSGVVFKAGSAANISPGTEVIAFTSRRNHEGGMAEYAKADIDQVMPKPKGLDFVQSASLPLSALTAWQALFQYGNLQKGQRLLITAAAGATGVFAVPFAKHIGAYVIGTGSSDRSREILKGYGIDQFVDYKKEGLKTAIKEPVDLVLDCVGGKAMDDAMSVVKKDGLLISINEYDCKNMAAKKGVRGQFFIVKMNRQQLSEIIELVHKGVVQPVVDKVFPFAEIPNAFKEAALGHANGKVVIQVTDVN